MTIVRTPGSRVADRDDPAWDEGGWRSHAACRGEDPDLLFPVGSVGPAARKQIAAAKAVCARCPVREACLRFALGTRQDYGVWGGLTEDERRGLRSRQQTAALRHEADPPGLRQRAC